MIKLTKYPIPAKLAANAVSWLKAYMEASTREQKNAALSKYRHAEIKDVLKAETGNKCAYCESSMLHVTYGDVEHIICKHAEPNLTFEWTNLTLVCDVCNTNKGAYHDPSLALINPYIDEPNEHFFVWGDQIWHKPNSSRSFKTITELELNRMPLVEKRRERITALSYLLTTYVNAHPGNKPSIKAQIQRELETDKEFLMFARAFIQSQNLGDLLA